MTTILDALQNARYNINAGPLITFEIGKEQINNCIILLQKGYPLDTNMNELLKKYPDINKIPKYKKQ